MILLLILIQFLNLSWGYKPDSCDTNPSHYCVCSYGCNFRFIEDAVEMVPPGSTIFLTGQKTHAPLRGFQTYVDDVTIKPYPDERVIISDGNGPSYLTQTTPSTYRNPCEYSKKEKNCLFKINNKGWIIDATEGTSLVFKQSLYFTVLSIKDGLTTLRGVTFLLSGSSVLDCRGFSNRGYTLCASGINTNAIWLESADVKVLDSGFYMDSQYNIQKDYFVLAMYEFNDNEHYEVLMEGNEIEIYGQTMDAACNDYSVIFKRNYIKSLRDRRAFVFVSVPFVHLENNIFEQLSGGDKNFVSFFGYDTDMVPTKSALIQNNLFLCNDANVVNSIIMIYTDFAGFVPKDFYLHNNLLYDCGSVSFVNDNIYSSYSSAACNEVGKCSINNNFANTNINFQYLDPNGVGWDVINNTFDSSLQFERVQHSTLYNYYYPLQEMLGKRYLDSPLVDYGLYGRNDTYTLTAGPIEFWRPVCDPECEIGVCTADDTCTCPSGSPIYPNTLINIRELELLYNIVDDKVEFTVVTGYFDGLFSIYLENGLKDSCYFEDSLYNGMYWSVSLDKGSKCERRVEFVIPFQKFVDECQGVFEQEVKDSNTGVTTKYISATFVVSFTPIDKIILIESPFWYEHSEFYSQTVQKTIKFEYPTKFEYPENNLKLHPTFSHFGTRVVSTRTKRDENNDFNVQTKIMFFYPKTGIFEKVDIDFIGFSDVFPAINNEVIEDTSFSSNDPKFYERLFLLNTTVSNSFCMGFRHEYILDFVYRSEFESVNQPHPLKIWVEMEDACPDERFFEASVEYDITSQGAPQVLYMIPLTVENTITTQIPMLYTKIWDCTILIPNPTNVAYFRQLVSDGTVTAFGTKMDFKETTLSINIDKKHVMGLSILFGDVPLTNTDPEEKLFYKTLVDHDGKFVLKMRYKIFYENFRRGLKEIVENVESEIELSIPFEEMQKMVQFK